MKCGPLPRIRQCGCYARILGCSREDASANYRSETQMPPHSMPTLSTSILQRALRRADTWIKRFNSFSCSLLVMLAFIQSLSNVINKLDTKRESLLSAYYQTPKYAEHILYLYTCIEMTKLIRKDIKT